MVVNSKDVSGLYQNPQTSFRVNKSVRSTDINSFSHFPSKTPLSFSPTATNSGTEENGSHESQVLLNKESELELLWWMKNIEIYNEKTFSTSAQDLLLQMLRLQVGAV